MVSQVLSEAVVEEVEQSLRPAKVISVLPCSGIRIVYIMPRLPLLCALALQVPSAFRRPACRSSSCWEL